MSASANFSSNLFGLSSIFDNNSSRATASRICGAQLSLKIDNGASAPVDADFKKLLGTVLSVILDVVIDVVDEDVPDVAICASVLAIELIAVDCGVVAIKLFADD